MEMQNLFEKFGGTRKMAAALEEAPSTVNSWKVAGRVPAHRQPNVLDRAREMGLDVTAEDIVFPLGIPASIEPAPPLETGIGIEFSAAQQERRA